MSGEKHKVKLAAYIIPRRGNEVLLSLRKNTGYRDGYYSLVAGHVEANESTEEGAIREAREESGIELRVDQLKFVYLMHRLSSDPNDEYIDVFFEVREWQGELTNQEPEKCGGLDWFAVDNLPDNTIPYVKEVLMSYTNGGLYSSRQRDDS